VAPGRYIFKVKGTNNDGLWNQEGTSLYLLIRPPWWQTWWFTSISILVTLGLVYGGFRYRVSQVRKQEQQKANFNKKVSGLEMQALRAQMNPHFIFNSLNSINRFILKNNPEAASDYLSKFSRLIRLILQNSNTPTIPLENELEALNLYLELEALRFKGKFTFCICCEKEVEVNYIEIPPLIIQPYVENAIWHGLMHKEGMGHIRISVEQQQELLTCIIEDDGIGRVRAAQFKSKSATKSKSLGMQITAHRLELLHALNGKQIRVEVVDLVDDSAQACGTKVILSLPIGLSIE
jgi:LytS/YehU family sensor histidine kinase